MSKAPKKAPEKLPNFFKIAQTFSVFVKSTQKSSQKAPKFWRDFNLATSLLQEESKKRKEMEGRLTEEVRALREAKLIDKVISVCNWIL